MTLNAIRGALEAPLLTLLRRSGLAVELAPPGQSRPPRPDRLTVRWHTAFGEVFSVEKNGLCRRVGAFVITLLVPANTVTDDALELAFALERLFHQTALPCDEARLICAEPYTTDAGLNAEKRAVISVTVPWFIYFANKETKL